MNPTQIEWLTKLGATADEKAEGDKKSEMQAAVLAQVHAKLEELTANHAAALKGFDAELSGARSRYLGRVKKLKTIHKGGDQTQEFDTDDAADGYGLAGDAKADYTTEKGVLFTKAWNSLQGADAALQALRELMQSATYDGVDDSGQAARLPLFDKREIGEELYTPLVEMRIMPDNFVPDEFSRTKEMLKGTYDAYEERLGQSREDSRGIWSFVKGDVLGGDSMGATIAKSALGNPTNFDDNSPLSAKNLGFHQMLNVIQDKNLPNQFMDSEQLGSVLQLSGYIELADTGLMLFGKRKEIGEVAKMGVDKIKGVIDARRKVKPSEFVPLAKALSIAVGTELAKAIQASAPGDKPVEKAAGQILSMVDSRVKAGVLSKHLANGEAQEAIALLGAALKNALAACDPKPTANVQAPPAPLAAIGATVESSFTTAASVETVKTALDKEKPEAGRVLDLLRKAARQAAAAVAGNLAATLGAAQVRQDLEANVTEQLQEDFAEAYGDPKAELEAELQEIEHAKSGPERDNLIEQKIKEWKRINMMMELPAKLVTAGFESVSRFVPMLGPVNAAIRFAANCAKTAIRAQDMLKWFSNRSDFLKSSSPYAAAADNLFSNQRLHAAHYSINATLQLGIMIAGIVKLSGPWGLAGQVAETALDATATIESLMYKVYKEKRLRSAWNYYKRSLYRPKNRRLALLAVKNNPTLAKYALAYGAFVAEDPLCISASHKCGLNADTLQESKKDSNIHQVVEFYEERFVDDGKVVKARSKLAKWAPAVALTAGSWAACKAAGEAKAGVQPANTGPIEQLLSQVEKKGADFEKQIAAGVPQQGVAQFRLDLEASLTDFADLLAQLRTYTPRDAKGAIHAEMAAVRDRFMTEASSVHDAIKALKEKWEVQNPPPPPPGGPPPWKAPAIALNTAAWNKFVAAATDQAVDWDDTGAAAAATEIVWAESLEGSLDAAAANNTLNDQRFTSDKTRLGQLRITFGGLATTTNGGQAIPALPRVILSLQKEVADLLGRVQKRETKFQGARPANWAPSPLALTKVSWEAAADAAEQQAQLNAAASDDARITAALDGNKVVLIQAQGAQNYDADAYQTVRDNLYDLKEALAAYKPKNNSGDAHTEMAAVARQFLALANLRIKELDAQEKQDAPAL